jgi:hypothetical protein
LVELASTLAKGGLRPIDLGIGMNEYQYLAGHWDIVAQIMALTDTKRIDRVELVKRKAAEELDEYIYSARKNREVLMNRIPIECVVAIRLNAEQGKWPGLNKKEFRVLANVMGQSDANLFSDFTPELRDDLLKYFARADDEKKDPYWRLKEMFKLAAKGKLSETGRT